MRSKVRRSSAANSDGAGFLAAVRSCMSLATRGASSGSDGRGASSAGRGASSAAAALTGPATHTKLLLVVAATFAALLALAPAAHATKEVDRFIGGDPGGELGQFQSPQDVAVNESTGQIYVVDELNGRIERLSSDGTPELAWGKDVVAGNANQGYEICTTAQECKSGEEGQDAGEFKRASGIAIDQSDGSVYVWDARAGNAASSENLRIQKFDSDGNFILMFGKQVNATTGADICTAASGDTCQAGLETSDPGGFGNPSITRPSLAVSPLDGDVFVADPLNRRVQRFNPDGTFVEAFGSSAQFSTRQPRHVAVDSQGIVYASNGNPAGESRIERYDSAGVHGAPSFLDPIEATPSGGPLLPGTSSSFTDSPTMGLEVDLDSDGTGPDVDSLYVLRVPDSGDTVVQQIDDPGTASAPTAVSDTHGAAAGFDLVAGLGLNSASGDMYISGGFPVGRGYFLLDDDGTGDSPTASGPNAANVTATSADLAGTVDTDDGVATYHFEYSADGVNYSSTDEDVIDASGPQEVFVPVGGLDPNTLYRLRLVVEKILGPDTIVSDTSAEVVFATAAAPPEVRTFGPANRTDTSVTLRAFVDPNGSFTTYRFEWGPAGGSFDRVVPIPDASAGSGNTELMLTESITGLLPETAYHYRIVAENSAGEDTGDPVTFTTKATPVPSPAFERAYELVSPADKVGGVGVGEWYSGPGSMAYSGFSAVEGERFAVEGRFGSLLLDSPQAFTNDWAFADRIDDKQGWLSHSPLTYPNLGPGLAVAVVIRSASDDLTHLAWDASANFRIFREETKEEWTSLSASVPYLADSGSKDAPARWEFWGPTDPALIDDSGQGSSVWNITLAGERFIAAGMTTLANGIASVRGMGGPTDPTHPDHDDLEAGRSIYLGDLSGGPADNFADTGKRELVSVCTGTAGADRTDLPEVDGSGKLVASECPQPQPGRDARLTSSHGASLELTPRRGFLDGTISDDGSRLFFLSPDSEAPGVPDGTSSFCTSAGEVCPAQLFVRQENPDGSVVTRWISRAENGLFGNQEASLTGTVRFEGASPDGSVVFFRTNSPLTADDPNGAGAPTPGGVTTGNASDESWDLYRFELAEGADPTGPGSSLTRISAGPNADGDCNAPLGGSDDIAALRFASEDGSRVYFTCAAPLPGVPVAQNGTITEPAGDVQTDDHANLYLYDEHLPQAERWRFVARLPRSTSGSSLDSCASTGTRTDSPLKAQSQQSEIGLNSTDSKCVVGTSDGGFVTLFTSGRLTADDPKAEPTGDIYGYDATSDELIRITAPQGGVGGSYPCAPDNSSVACHGDPGVSSGAGKSTNIEIPTDPAEPTAFFESRARLIPEDRDDAYDVYQWRDGELSLITSGQSETDGAIYKGTDSTGENVYFVTLDQYSWQDFDDVADIYTARVGGGIEEPAPPPVCGVLDGACQDEPASDPAPQPSVDSEAERAGNPPMAQKRLPNRCKRLAFKTRRITIHALRLRRAARQAQGPRARVLTVRTRRAIRVTKQARRATQRCRIAQRRAIADRRAGK